MNLAVARCSRIRDEAPKATKFRDRAANHVSHLILVGNVTGEADCLAASSTNLLNSFFSELSAYVSNRDKRPFFGDP